MSSIYMYMHAYMYACLCLLSCVHVHATLQVCVFWKLLCLIPMGLVLMSKAMHLLPLAITISIHIITAVIFFVCCYFCCFYAFSSFCLIGFLLLFFSSWFLFFVLFFSYQIPPLVREKTAVVISPLLALMQDQVLYFCSYFSSQDVAIDLTKIVNLYRSWVLNNGA